MHIWLTYLFGRNAQNIYAPRIQINLLFPGSRAFSVFGTSLWSVTIRIAQRILTFRKLLKSHVFDLAFPP